MTSRLLPLALTLALTAPAAQPQITIAAAANLSDVMPLIGDAFESATHIHPVFTYGATAQLTQQIENGAPIDVFAAADIAHVDQLAAKGLITKATQIIYATGSLALWFPANAGSKIEDLTNPQIRVIAIAKPELAPYGQAAINLLKRRNLFDRSNPKIVYASSISMAKQYGLSGNADAVFAAKSLLLNVKGTVVTLDAELPQAAGMVTGSKNQKAAVDFLHFLLGPEARKILLKYGYKSLNQPDFLPNINQRKIRPNRLNALANLPKRSLT